MDQFTVGDVIEHRLMPGFLMPVLEARECEMDYARPEEHLAYRVTDPQGNDDWLCAYDVQKPGEGLAWGAGPAGERGASFSNGPETPKLISRSLPPLRQENSFARMEGWQGE